MGPVEDVFISNTEYFVDKGRTILQGEWPLYRTVIFPIWFNPSFLGGLWSTYGKICNTRSRNVGRSVASIYGKIPSCSGRFALWNGSYNESYFPSIKCFYMSSNSVSEIQKYWLIKFFNVFIELPL